MLAPILALALGAITRSASAKPYPAVDFNFPSPPTRTGTASCYNSCHVAINNN
jgi:hypothetical protein